MWAFCFHLSVNSDAVKLKKKKKKGSTSTATRFPEVTEVFIRAGGSAKKKKQQQCVRNACALMRGLGCWRTAEDWHMEEMKKRMDHERIVRCLPGVCLTVVLSRHDILEQFSPCYPEICKDKDQNATSLSIHSAERERERGTERRGDVLIRGKPQLQDSLQQRCHGDWLQCGGV